MQSAWVVKGFWCFTLKSWDKWWSFLNIIKHRFLVSLWKIPWNYQEVPFPYIVINTVNDESGFLDFSFFLFLSETFCPWNPNLLKFCRNVGLQDAGEVPFLPGGSAPIPGVQKHLHNRAQNLPHFFLSPFPPVPHVGFTPSSYSLLFCPDQITCSCFFFFPRSAHKFRMFDSIARVILALLTQFPGCCWPFRLSPQKVPSAPFQIVLKSAFLSHKSH